MKMPNHDFCGRFEAPDPSLGELGRRDFLFRLGRGVGGVALSSMLFQEGLLGAGATGNPLAPKRATARLRPGHAFFCLWRAAPARWTPSIPNRC